jgi:hypothetical protein
VVFLQCGADTRSAYGQVDGGGGDEPVRAERGTSAAGYSVAPGGRNYEDCLGSAREKYRNVEIGRNLSI